MGTHLLLRSHFFQTIKFRNKMYQKYCGTRAYDKLGGVILLRGVISYSSNETENWIPNVTTGNATFKSFQCHNGKWSAIFSVWLDDLRW